MADQNEAWELRKLTTKENIVETFSGVLPEAAFSGTNNDREKTLGAVASLASHAFHAYDNPSSINKAIGLEEQTREWTKIHTLFPDMVTDYNEETTSIKISKVEINKKITLDQTATAQYACSYLIITAGIVRKQIKIEGKNAETIGNPAVTFVIRKNALDPNEQFLKVHWVAFTTDNGDEASIPESTLFNEESKRANLVLHFSDQYGAKEGRKNIGETRTLKSVDKGDNSLKVNVEFTLEFGKAKEYIELVKQQNFQVASVEWSRKCYLCFQPNISEGYQYIYFDNPASDMQAWLIVHKEKKSMVLAFRGTEQTSVKDTAVSVDVEPAHISRLATIKTTFISTELENDTGNVHRGYLEAYLSLQEAILQTILSITRWKREWNVCITGHSLGAALATICSYDLVKRKYEDTTTGAVNIGPQIGMINFAPCRLGDQTFVKNYKATEIAGFSLVNQTDVYPKHPKRYAILRECNVAYGSSASAEGMDNSPVDDSQVDDSALNKLVETAMEFLAMIGMSIPEPTVRKSERYFPGFLVKASYHANAAYYRCFEKALPSDFDRKL